MFLLHAGQEARHVFESTMSGILKQSQNLTKRAAFTEASISRTPARNAG